MSSGDSRDDIGTVAYLRLKAAKLVEKANPILQKTEGWTPTVNTLYSTPFKSERAEKMFYTLPLPDTLEVPAHRMRDELQFQKITDREVPAGDAIKCLPSMVPGRRSLLAQSGNWLSVGSISAPSIELDEEVRGCFNVLQAQLAKVCADLTAVAHINLYLSSMSLFPAVNAIYNTFFGPSPPTRACVSALLPEGQHLLMDAVAYIPNSSSAIAPRTALHVRSISFWAPANIGPYSQSVNVGGRVFVAGQIALRPPTLQLEMPREFAFECALSTQHVRRIVTAMQGGTGGGFKGHMESCVCWLSGPKAAFEARRDSVRLAWRAWLGKQAEVVPMVIVQVPELPRDAMVEWQIIWHTGRSEGSSDDEDNDEEGAVDMKPTYASSRGEGYHTQGLRTGKARFGLSAISSDAEPLQAGTTDSPAFSMRGFHTGATEALQALVESRYGPNAQYTAIQVLSLATLHLDSADAALCALSHT